MNNKEVEEWIKTLRVGDKVAVKRDVFGTISYYTETIKKITPKGQIRLNDDSLFKTNGVKQGEYSQPCIVPYDQTIKDSFRKNKICGDLLRFKYVDLPLEKLEEIYKIVMNSNNENVKVKLPLNEMEEAVKEKRM